jgi:DNA-binding transcriptional regulator LsrR (DeoR family)
MSRIDELRLIARITLMYHEWDMCQSEIADQLGLSQATISRMLRQAKEEGIIRISINLPDHVYTDLEEKLIKKFKLRDVIVVDSWEDNESLIQRDIGSAAAYYLESTVRPNEVIGISSWSATLLELVDSLHPIQRKPGVKVVQILGGVGNPSVEAHAARLTSRMAQLVKGEAIYLPVSGVVTSKAARDILLADEASRQAIQLFDKVTIALVGIGAINPSPLLAQSGNIFAPEEYELLHDANAVGDMLYRFYDAKGKLVKTGLENRVVSMSLDQLSKVDRAIGVAGGARKFDAILGALRGRYINILVTDHFTAKRLAAV